MERVTVVVVYYKIQKAKSRIDEMTSMAPISRGPSMKTNGCRMTDNAIVGFGGYASHPVDPALWFAAGEAYFFKYLLATPNPLTAAALISKVGYNYHERICGFLIRL
jgi:hypothetical protein